MKIAFRLAASAVLLLALAGCGYTPGQRALTGGGIGAASGAVLGAALFGNPAMGALARIMHGGRRA